MIYQIDQGSQQIYQLRQSFENYYYKIYSTIISMKTDKFEEVGHQETEQMDMQNTQPEYYDSFVVKYQTTILCVLISILVFTTCLNVFASDIQTQTHKEFLQQNQIFFTQNNSLSLGDKIIAQYNQSKYDFPLSPKAKQRLSYGQPRPKNRFIRAVVFTKKNQTSPSSVCLFTNGISIISSKTTGTAKIFLQKGEIKKWIVFLASTDLVADDVINAFMSQTQNKYQKKSFELTIDSDYQFVKTHAKGCDSLIYVQNNFMIDSDNAKLFIEKATKLQKEVNFGYVSYSLLAKNHENGTINLENLMSVDLFTVKQEKFNQYVYIIDTQLYQFATPLNFVYFNKFTLQQMLIFPILALTQNSTYLTRIQQAFHVFDQAVVQFKDFQLQNPRASQQKKQFCFVSYPEKTKQINFNNVKRYINSITQTLHSQYLLSVIVNVPYNVSTNNKGLNELLRTIKQIRKQHPMSRYKIRIHYNKTLSSLSIYQSVYNFCPQNSMVISSRFNIKFQSSFLKELANSLSQKHHYYYVGGLDVSKSTVSSMIRGKNKQQRFNSALFVAQFMNTQIFKSSLFKMIPMWVLKYDEIQFFQTQASFVIPLLEMCDYSIKKFGDSKLISLIQPRKPCEHEQKQIKILQQYGKWDKIKDNLLQPIKYNSLTNLDLRRGTLNQIPKVIHQIWFINDEIPKKITRLQETIKSVNKDYEYKLWRRQNLTTFDFPFSYGFIAQVLQYEQAYGKCFHRWIQALMSYQVLYNHGGFYLSLKAEAVRPLDPFLKYQLVFAGFYNLIGQYGAPFTVGREVMGSKIHGYHMRFIIAQLITQQRINVELNDYEALVGGDVVRLSLTNNQLYTTTFFGFNLFTYDAYRNSDEQCQQKRDLCKQYKQAYIKLHSF